MLNDGTQQLAGISTSDSHNSISSVASTMFTGSSHATALNYSTRANYKDTNDFIICNSTTGALYYDADGSVVGAAVQFAVLPVGLGSYPSTHLFSHSKQLYIRSVVYM